MTKSAFITARIEPEIKQHAEEILHELGISPSQAITMLYRHVMRENKWPMELKIPNTRTQKVFEETDKGINIVECKNTKEMFKNLSI